MKRLLLLLFSAVLLFACTGCTKEEPLSRTSFFMDTVCTITLYDSADETLLDKAFEICKEYETLFSRTVETSDVAKLNRMNEGMLEVHPATAELLTTALEYAELTGGKFDVTVGRLTSLWDFKAERPALPQQSEIESALSQVGYQNLSVEGTNVTVKGGIQLDLGGIAKGYIADRCAEFLKENGVKRAIINLGGNVVVVGSKEEGKSWTVGIQQPFADHDRVVATVEVSDCSLVTSGIYERSFEVGGTLYHHILDPQTGYPVSNGLSAVTILSESSTRADALSTSCFLLGKEKALTLIESLPDTEAIFIDEDGGITTTSGVGTVIPFAPVEP